MQVHGLKIHTERRVQTVTILRTMTWSHPDFWIIFATSFAVIGARLLSFLSCLAYGKRGMTAVIRFALAILQA